MRANVLSKRRHAEFSRADDDNSEGRREPEPDEQGVESLGRVQFRGTPRGAARACGCLRSCGHRDSCSNDGVSECAIDYGSDGAREARESSGHGIALQISRVMHVDLCGRSGGRADCVGASI